MARTALSKKTRFEVFKRDAFACQYCGAHPPGVLLHIDHVVPVAGGGTNDIDNLVTSCDACNLGKGARSLTVIPETLAEKARIVAEREEQLLGYQAILQARRDRLDDETWQVLHVMFGKVESVKRDEYSSTRRFIEKLGLHEVLDGAEIAMASSASYRMVFRYFCGVCWNKVRDQQQVEEVRDFEATHEGLPKRPFKDEPE